MISTWQIFLQLHKYQNDFGLSFHQAWTEMASIRFYNVLWTLGFSNQMKSTNHFKKFLQKQSVVVHLSIFLKGFYHQKSLRCITYTCSSTCVNIYHTWDMTNIWIISFLHLNVPGWKQQLCMSNVTVVLFFSFLLLWALFTLQFDVRPSLLCGCWTDWTLALAHL